MFVFKSNLFTKVSTVKSLLENRSIRKCSPSNQIFNNILFNTLGQRNFSSANKEFGDSVEIDYDAVTNGDKELEHKLKVLILEAEVMRQEGKRVPENSELTVEHLKELLNTSSRSSRAKYLEFLFKRAKTRENEQAKKLEKRRRFEERKEQIAQEREKEETFEDFALQHDLRHNNMFIRFRDTTINRFYNNRLIQAMRFGQKLVVDCGFDQNMTKRENLLCAKQLMLLFAENRNHHDPYDVHYCNMNKGTLLESEFAKFIPKIYEPDFPLNVHECSYLDLFPKHQLVYLTPHCQKEMLEYDHDAVYIIGGLVDKVNCEPMSLAKAKKEELNMAKLPLDRYLQWGAGSGKSLTLNQMVLVLLDMKSTGNWAKALRHVPRRKIIDAVPRDRESKASKTYHYNGQAQVRGTKWVPDHQIDFNNLKFNPDKKQRKESNPKLDLKRVFSE